MTLTLTPDIEKELTEEAQRRGTTPERLALERLRANGAATGKPSPGLEPRDEWDRLLATATSNCGVSLSDEAVSSEGIYD